MKKRMIAILLVLNYAYGTQAQEMVMDSVNREKFTGVHQAGDMGEFIYIPYFTTNKNDKKNFIIRQLSAHTFSGEQNLRFELPASYILKNSAFNGSSYLLHFNNPSAKEEVLISVTGENINKKKTFKSGNEQYYLLDGATPEDFIIVTTDNKGNYKIQQTGTDLETKWEKKFSAPSGVDRQIISIHNKMGRAEVVRKDTRQGNKYEFSVHTLQMDSGEDLGEKTLVKDGTPLYPTFFSEREGMNFTGGYYFDEGVYSKQPLGIFFALISPDGHIEQIAKVPYSQVIEDLKNTVGAQISQGNSAIIFTDGYMAHETQQFIMAGQIVTRQDGENSSTINFGDFVSVKFSIEKQSFKGAASTKYDGSQAVIKGNTTTTNTLDLGMWLSHCSLMPLSHFVNTPGMPIVAYKDFGKDGQVNICLRPFGVKNDTTRPECMMLFRERQEPEPYVFSGKLTEKPIQYSAIIPSGHDIGNIATYELTKNLLLIAKTPLPRLENLMRPLSPEEMGHHMPEDAPEAPPQPQEGK